MNIRRACALLVSQLVLGLSILGGMAPLGNIHLLSRAATPNPSYVRVLHASPFVGTADVFVDGNLLLSSFQFGAITDYASIPAGPHKVQIALVGKGINAAAITQTLNVTAGQAYTVSALGTQASDLSLKVFSDDNYLSGNPAKLRFYQLSPDAGATSVADGGTSLISSTDYPNASDYTSIQPGAYTFTVTPTTSPTGHTISATIASNTVTSIFSLGMLNGNPQYALISAHTPGLPGMPDTGSDPSPQLQSPETFSLPSGELLSALGIASLLLLGGCGLIGWLVRKR